MSTTPLPLLPSSFLLCLALSAAPAPAQRVPDVRVQSTSPGAAAASAAKIGGIGDTVYAVWHDVRMGRQDTFFSRSTDGGASWPATNTWLDATKPVSRDSLGVTLCSDGARVYVAWEDYRHSFTTAADIYFNRSLDGGVTWLQAEVRIDTKAPGSSASRNPKLACRGDQVFAVWEDNRSGKTDIYFSRSSDGGATWLAADVRLDTGDPPGASLALLPEVCCAGSAVHVAWEDDRGGNRDIYFNRSIDGGATWLGAAVRVDTAPPTAWSLQPQIACAGSDVYLVWEDDRNGFRDIYFNRSGDSGSTWLPADVRLDTGTGPSQNARLCVDGSRIYVTWLDNRTFSNTQILFNRSLDGGATWLSPDRVVNTTTAGCISVNPAIACAGGAVAVSWISLQCGGPTAPDVYLNRSLDAGLTWLPADTRMNTDPAGTASSADPRVRMDADRCQVVWIDFRHSTLGRGDVQVNMPWGMPRYGTGLAGAGGLVPVLSGTGRSTLASAFSIDVQNAVGGAPAALLIGLSRASVPVFGGTVLVTPAVSPSLALSGAAGVPGAGAAALPLTLPASPAFVGTALFWQALVIDPAAALGISMSNGVELWIG